MALSNPIDVNFTDNALKASRAQQTADTANTTANDANTTANNAQTTANDAKTTADTASSQISTVSQSAQNANESAQKAVTDAQTAVANAQTALSNAQKAQQDAQAASDNAQTAQTNAQTAITSAQNAQASADKANADLATAKAALQKAQADATSAQNAVTNAQNQLNALKFDSRNYIAPAYWASLGQNGYLASDGTVTTGSNDVHSDYISVDSNKVAYFSITKNSTSGSCCVAFYDSNKKLISYKNLTADTGLTIPDGCAYMRLSSPISSLGGEFKFEFSTKATSYSPAPEDVTLQIQQAQEQAETANNNVTKAQQDAQTAIANAQTAQTNAQTAIANANKAQADAQTAQATANTANSNAQSAQTTANKAEQDAQDAQNGIALVKKTYFSDNVYFQQDQPTDPDDGAIWFKIEQTQEYLNYHDDSSNGGTESTTQTVTVKVPNDGLSVTTSGTFTWNQKQPIKKGSPSMTATTSAYTYNGLSANYQGKIIESGVLWCFYKAYNGNMAYVPIKNLQTGTRYGTDTNSGSDPEPYHEETQTVTIPGTTGNAVNDSQITLNIDNIDSVQSYANNTWTGIDYQKQIVGASIMGASIDSPLISLGDGGVIWSSYSIAQDPRYYFPIASQGTVAMAQGELIVSGQTQYYDSNYESWAYYDSNQQLTDGNDTNYTTSIINAGGIKNEMQDSARANLIGRSFLDATHFVITDGQNNEAFRVNKSQLTHAVKLQAPDVYAANRVHTGLIQPDGATDALKLESGTGDSRVQSQSIYNATNSHAGNVYITVAGSLTRSTSASKYKLDIHEMQDLDSQCQAILKLTPKYWFDKGQIEDYVEKTSNGETPMIEDETREIPGLIAEDLHEVGLDKYLYFGQNGEIEGIEYAKLWVLLIPIIQKLVAKVGI